MRILDFNMIGEGERNIYPFGQRFNVNSNSERDRHLLFSGKIEVVSGSLWSNVEDDYDNISEGKVVLVKWTYRKNVNRITIYTLERRNNQFERWIRVYPLNEFPVYWDYESCTSTPDEMTEDEMNRMNHNEELMCDMCFDLCSIRG